MTIAVLYHSGYGHTAEQAKAVARGANADLVALDKEKGLDDAGWAKLDAADAIIFGCPTYMGDVSAVFKQFMEVSSKRWMERKWQDKLAAGFTNSASQNGDKAGTMNSLSVFAAQHGMIWVSLGIAPGNNNSHGSPDDLNRLGGSLGALAQSNADEGPDKGPIPSDLKTAEALGKRVADIAARFKK